MFPRGLKNGKLKTPQICPEFAPDFSLKFRFFERGQKPQKKMAIVEKVILLAFSYFPIVFFTPYLPFFTPFFIIFLPG